MAAAFGARCQAHQPHWHTYWKNAGDSGLPTKLEWTLPAGVTAGDIAWPAPQKIAIGTLANFGFEGTVLLPVPLTIAMISTKCSNLGCLMVGTCTTSSSAVAQYLS